MDLNKVDGLVVATGCLIAGAVVGLSVGYIYGHEDGVKDTTGELLDFVAMLESEDNQLSASTQKAAQRLKDRSLEKLSEESFDVKSLVRSLGTQTKNVLSPSKLS